MGPYWHLVGRFWKEIGSRTNLMTYAEGPFSASRSQIERSLYAKFLVRPFLLGSSLERNITRLLGLEPGSFTLSCGLRVAPPTARGDPSWAGVRKHKATVSPFCVVYKPHPLFFAAGRSRCWKWIYVHSLCSVE